MAQFAETLKSWRKARRFSQLDLALEADVSSRHISFLETGRAAPSREMVLKLGETLQLPLSARNQMLTHAGFAPRYRSREWDAAEMQTISQALDYTLNHHAPYPAFATDRLWTVVRMNEPARKLFGLLGIKEGKSILEILVADIAEHLFENWSEVAHHSLLRLRTESAAQGGIEEFSAAIEKLSKVPPPTNTQVRPVIPAIYRHGDMRLSLFSTIAHFGTPEDITLDDFKIELFFPADEETRQALQKLA